MFLFFFFGKTLECGFALEVRKFNSVFVCFRIGIHVLSFFFSLSHVNDRVSVSVFFLSSCYCVPERWFENSPFLAGLPWSSFSDLGYMPMN